MSIKRSLNPLIAVVCGLILGFGIPMRSFALTNIVINGSFEDGGVGWAANGEFQIYYNSTAADGNMYVSAGPLWQDLTTIPGRDYVIIFAQLTDYFSRPMPTVTWNGTVIGPPTNFASIGSLWKYHYCHARASSNITRLTFGPGVIDDVKVSWLQEPMRIVTQPQSRSGLEGGTVNFLVTADGAPPVGYQWRFNGQPIIGATGRSFTITSLREIHAGNYSVVISNASGVITSQDAALLVTTPPTSPEIIAQPIGDVCPAGYGCSLTVLAVGALPLRYQWIKNGADVAGATNRSLRFEAVQVGDAGTYTVLVSNDRGTVLSLAAPLVVTNTSGGGRFVIDTATNNAPIYDVDGATRLEGTNFLVQVYAGPAAQILRPVGAANSFFTGTHAGYLRAVYVEIPDVAPGQKVYVQLRAWAAAAGASYEEARAAGGKFGFSRVFEAIAGTFGPQVLTESFSLRAGEPFFITGRLSVGEPLPNGTREFILTGDAGFRYLIEKRFPPNNWSPLLTVTNTTGSVVFTDPEATAHAVQFYRARILD
jgi:hypothetical protein